MVPAFLVRNSGVKVAALFFAVVLWLYVASGKDYLATFDMPIELVNMPDNLMPAEPFPSHSLVKVSGSGRQLFGLKLFSKMKVMVDVFHARPGRGTFLITNDDVYLGGVDVRIVAIEKTPKLEIVFDKIAYKTVPVKARVDFKTDENYVQIGKYMFDPDKIKIKGPEANVSHVQEIFTQDYSLYGLKKDTTVTVAIMSPPEFNISCVPSRVAVKVRVQKLVSRDLKDIPVNLINAPLNVKARLDSVNISLTIVGGEEVVNNFTPNDLNIFVDYHRFTAESLEAVPPAIVKFKEVECRNISPQVFRLIQEK